MRTSRKGNDPSGDSLTLWPCGAAAAAPRASRAGLPLCGSGPDNVWQSGEGCSMVKMRSSVSEFRRET